MYRCTLALIVLAVTCAVTVSARPLRGPLGLPTHISLGDAPTIDITYLNHSSVVAVEQAHVANKTMAEPTCTPRYTEVDLRPHRYMWFSEDGYCGESAIQMVVLKRGIWISQRAARKIGVDETAKDPTINPKAHIDTRFERVNSSTGILAVLRTLGLDSEQWGEDNQTLATFPSAMHNVPGRQTGITRPSVFGYLFWVKQQILRGRPVIVADRLKAGRPADHIQPIFGVKYCREDALDRTDVFQWTGDLADEGPLPLNNTHFFTNQKECTYDLDFNDTMACLAKDYFNYGVGVGGLIAPPGLYKPTAVSITGWDDEDTEPYEEPGEKDENDKSAQAEKDAALEAETTAEYNLTITNLTVGQPCTLYKFSGLFPTHKVPQSEAAMEEICDAPPKDTGCAKGSFVATAPTMMFVYPSNASDAVPLANDTASFMAKGIEYFLTICKDSPGKNAQEAAPAATESQPDEAVPVIG